MKSLSVAAALAAVLTAACAVRLGGPEPVEMTVAAVEASAAADAATVGGRLAADGARMALLAAPHDSAWFAAVATAAGMELSGPGPAGTTSLGFLARRTELLGDTTIALEVASGGQVFLHDALYRMEDDRLLDLMLARMLPGVGVREGVRTLLEYIATDVSDDAGIILALHAASPAAADSASSMVLAYLENARECAGNRAVDPEGLRLFYGPGARIRCLSAATESAAPATVVTARIVVGR